MRRLLTGSLLVMALGLGAAQAQAPGRWVKLAAFPEPSEELYGASAGGKLYVFGGLAPGWKPKALVYEYDPAADRWAKKKPMALASHHVAFTELGGKLYAFGGFVLPEAGPPAWVPIDNAWEYDPAGDAWKALAPMPTKRGSPVAATVNGKIYVIGGASVHPGSSEPAVLPTRPHRALTTVEEYDPATVRRDATDDFTRSTRETTVARCTLPAGASPAPVSAGAPGSRLHPARAIAPDERSVKSP
jgi:Kelch motif protein